MKIICIARNYVEHTKELNNPLPSEPIFFMKPDTSLILNNQPFFLPDFSNDLQHEVEIVLKINKLGKNIDEQFAHRYYDEIGIGIDFTARDLQRKMGEGGKPWEIAKAFDGSAPLGKFIKKEMLPDPKAINFRLEINGTVVQHGNTRDMIFTFDRLISFVSRYVTLKIGDLVYTGTPSGVSPVKIGDHLTAYIEDSVMLDFDVK